MGDKCGPNDAAEMNGCRSRDENGELRHKRGDTLARTIEKQYDVDLGVRGDARLDTLRDRTGQTSIAGVIAALQKHS
ncbi:MAG TPA: hypothetical protein VGM77_12840 [Gemmatimonadales bacterium]|jgi:hypothetical protein